MAKVTIALREALRRAVTAYNGGKFSEAEALCHAIIAAKHDFFDAMHLLAVVQARLGRSSDASASFGRALAIRPLDVQRADRSAKKLRRWSFNGCEQRDQIGIFEWRGYQRNTRCYHRVSQGRVPLSQTESAKNSGHYPTRALRRSLADRV
jgi:hypothetical protein